MSTDRYMSKEIAKSFWGRIKTVLFNKTVTDVKISGKTVTVTKGDGSTSTQTTQDTTYGVVSKSANGLAPKLPDETTTTKYLRQDGTWVVPPNDNTTYSDATQTNHGLMSADDKKKLDGVETGANKYVHPTGSGYKHIPSGGNAGKILAWSDDGTADWTSVETTIEDIDMGGLDVIFKFNGKLAMMFTIPEASSTTGGVMSRLDKSKLDELPTGSDLSATYAKKSDITNMYTYKGSVSDVSKLPITGQQVGWVYNIESASIYGGAGMNVAWNGTEWDPLGEIFTVTEMTKADIDEICV